MGKLRIAVLRGGPSEEYDVSLNTGESVLSALTHESNASKYEPIDVIITRQGEWLVRGYVRDPMRLLNTVDAVFLALHGAYGEDGQLQRFLDSVGVPYTGSGAYPSAMAMNKVMAKDLLRQHGVRMPRHMMVGQSARRNLSGMVDTVTQLLGNQFVLKPHNGGSSIGVASAHNKEELYPKLSKLLNTYERVLIEEYIDGKEVTCSVAHNFRGSSLYAFPAVELVRPDDARFCGYTARYRASTERISPARLRDDERAEVQKIAKQVHRELGLKQYSSSDFVVTRDGIYFLEVNALPGLSSVSLLPQALGAVGCSTEQFIDHLLTDMLEQKQ